MFGLMRFLIAAAFVVTSSLTVSAQRFETHKVYLSDNGVLTKTIKIKPANKFSIKKDNRYTWVNYEKLSGAVKISATANTSKNSRNCIFVLIDEMGMPLDSLEVIQTGKVSTASSKVGSFFAMTPLLSLLL